MFSYLKNHPFAVEAFFESSLVLTFAVPKGRVQYLIPECLELDTFDDNWAFMAVAMVQTKGLRPKGFPKIFGRNFFLIGYRLFVRYTTNSGRHLRGLYILKSETDSKMMEIAGNMFTHYNYSTTDIRKSTENNIEVISSVHSGFNVSYKQFSSNIELPENSPFNSWKEARRFAGPLPFTFTYSVENRRVLIIEGVRSNWNPTPVEIVDYNFLFLETMGIPEKRLANAFIIENIPYYWKKGRIEQWSK